MQALIEAAVYRPQSGFTLDVKRKPSSPFRDRIEVRVEMSATPFPVTLALSPKGRGRGLR